MLREPLRWLFVSHGSSTQANLNRLTALRYHRPMPATPTHPVTAPAPRFAELMACLAGACELAMGQSADHALHSCAVSMRLAQAASLCGNELRNVYYQALLRFIGCNADAEAMASIAGDVIGLRQATAPLDMAQTQAVVAALIRNIRQTHDGEAMMPKAAAILHGLLHAGRFAQDIFPGHCEVAQRLGRRLGFDERFITGLGQLYARWDGKGVPAIKGNALMPAVRVAMLAQDVLIHHRQGGWPAVEALMHARSGKQYDPDLAARVLTLGPALVADLPGDWASVLAMEPPPHEHLEGAALDSAMAVLADYSDIQSPWLIGHARRVAALACAAARNMGMPTQDEHTLHLAALVHDIGRVGVSAHIWAHPGPLSQSDRDRMQLHSLYTTQILSRAPSLRALARLAGGVHERLDGSGYVGGLDASAQSPMARVLAAADVVAALGEARPHRPPFQPERIVDIVNDEVRQGRLDAQAAQAVLHVAGMACRPQTAPPLPAGLSAREAEVLGELARGLTNKEIARQLGSAPKTVGHQVQSVYRKIGVSTRAGATLFAMENGLVAPPR